MRGVNKLVCMLAAVLAAAMLMLSCSHSATHGDLTFAVGGGEAEVTGVSQSADSVVVPERPMMSDLRESGSIEQDADIVMMLYRDDYYNKDSEKYNICEIIIAKHRNGATGTVELTWQPQFTKFSDKARSGGTYE